MAPSKMLLVLLPIILLVSFSSIAVTIKGHIPLCLPYGNFTANDIYQSNLDTLLDSIATTTSPTLTYGLFNASVSPGKDSDGIHMMGYCRGDLSRDACQACLNDSAYEIRQDCPVQKMAVLFEDNCTIKYSNNSLEGVYTHPNVLWDNTENASDWDTFKLELKRLVVDLRGQAASGGSLRKYAEGTGLVDFYTLYVTVQCSPDLSEQECSDCLVKITERLPQCCQGKVGGRILTPSCQLRFATDRFFDPIAVPLPSPASQLPVMAPPPSSASLPGLPSQSGINLSNNKTWIGIAASSAAAVLVIGVLVFLIVKRKKHPMQGVIIGDVDDIGMDESLQLNLDIVRAATGDFSDVNKLGQGGFGSVFMGKLPNGQQIAVKRLSRSSEQGEEEFKNEVGLLARLQHRNLVRLLGFCLQGDEKLLVYEFLPNSSLDRFIFDPLKRACLDWDLRNKIITGIARGLLYLHEDSRLRIIHRDLKASNVLLDADMNPKVSDFGMARLFELDQTQADTSRIMGTYGYMAPEYVLRGHFSLKSDVFSFGVLVLEIVSGRRNLVPHSGEDSKMLIRHVWTNWREGNISNIVDPVVSSGYNVNILRCIHIGLLCVQENETNRPTMALVVLMLNSQSVTLPMPTHPAFLMNTSSVNDISLEIGSTSRTTEADHSRNNAGTFSMNEASITEPYLR